MSFTAVKFCTGKMPLQEASARCKPGQPCHLQLQDVALPARLEHLRSAMYHVTLVKTSANAFVQSAFAPLLADPKLQKAARHDCMRLHASMWGAASASSGAPCAQLQHSLRGPAFATDQRRCGHVGTLKLYPVHH